MRFLFIVLLMLGCETTKPECPPEEQTVLIIPLETLGDFPDGTEVQNAWLEKIDGQDYYYREGATRDKNCRLSRTPVKEIDGLIFMRLNGVSESCSGITCEHCTFPKTGGCKCKNIGQGVCKHTITKNRDMLRIE